ncbi:MAG: twin-arginine translocation signal domain-containing protein, partial [Thermodesulfobacteriota bacterium]
MSTYWHDHIDAAWEGYKAGACSRRDFLKTVTIAGAALGLMGGPFAWTRHALAADSIRFD